jgi:hypothetical protein
LENRVIDAAANTRSAHTTVRILNPIFAQISKRGFCTFALLLTLACAAVNATAASLFGDLSCQAWAVIDYPRKKIWTNAFLAPLSLTHQGLERSKQDRYNDDPSAVEPAVVSIDNFCIAHPQQSPADGAIAYLNELIKN